MVIISSDKIPSSLFIFYYLYYYIKDTRLTAQFIKTHLNVYRLSKVVANYILTTREHVLYKRGLMPKIIGPFC